MTHQHSLRPSGGGGLAFSSQGWSSRWIAIEPERGRGFVGSAALGIILAILAMEGRAGAAELPVVPAARTTGGDMIFSDGFESGDVSAWSPCLDVQSSFNPELKHHWAEGQVMMAPIVLPLDEGAHPEIVFSSFIGSSYNDNGTLHAISIVDDAIVSKWSANPSTSRIHPGRSIAGGDIDDSPGNEIVTCTVDNGVRAFDHDGTELWVSSYSGGCFMPSIADLDQDGGAEIIVRGGVLDGTTGATETTFSPQFSVVAADVDADDTLEIVGPQYVFELDGTLVADVGVSGHHVAVADLDGDLEPEIVTIRNSDHSLFVWRVDSTQPGGAEIIRAGVDINGFMPPCSGDTGGGPPILSDFSGDGVPDVGVAAGVAVTVFDGASLMDPAIANYDTLLWISPTRDCSSRRTGASAADLDQDGTADLLYSDEEYLRIYHGPTGAVLFQQCNTTGTLEELPVVADVDGDLRADIVVASNDYHSILCPDLSTQVRGIRVFGDPLWGRVPAVWNQHAYHVTNVDEQGTIPAVEVPAWTAGVNSFREQVQPPRIGCGN